MDPSPRFPGVTVQLTRRVRDREARLLPEDWLKNAMGYVLSIVANHYGLEVYAFCGLPNHYHMVARDPRGALSEFKRDFHSVLARLIIDYYKEDREGLWAPRLTNEVQPLDNDSVVDSIAYVISNPVHHGLVRDHADYPGLNFRWPQEPLTFDRPKDFFRAIKWREGLLTGAGRPKINWTETATLTLHRPHGFDQKVDLKKSIARAIAAKEVQAHEELGEDFGTKDSVLALGRNHRSKPQLDELGKPIRELFPRYKGPTHLREKAYAELRAWRAEYRAALAAYQTDKTVVFPYGTNLMARRYKVNVAPAPDV